MPWPFAWTDERKELVRDLWAQGFTCLQIANELGVSRNAVVGIVHRNGFKREAPINRPQPRQPKPENGRIPPAPPVLAVTPPGGFRLEQLSDSQCRWPGGDGPFVFCGQPKERGGTAYCAEHRRKGHAQGHHR